MYLHKNDVAAGGYCFCALATSYHHPVWWRCRHPCHVVCGRAVAPHARYNTERSMTELYHPIEGLDYLTIQYRLVCESSFYIIFWMVIRSFTYDGCCATKMRLLLSIRLLSYVMMMSAAAKSIAWWIVSLRSSEWLLLLLLPTSTTTTYRHLFLLRELSFNILGKLFHVERV